MPRCLLGIRRACENTGKSSVPLGTRTVAMALNSASAMESSIAIAAFLLLATLQ
jgi:hypothetical protein